MRQFNKLVKRNIKLFFQDKALFFTSLITPLVLLLLYSTFLANIFTESYSQMISKDMTVSKDIITGLVNGQVFGSIISVSCVTVAFCSNMLMVQDKVTGVRKDFLISPLKKYKLALSYFVSTYISTLIICLFASFCCFIYTALTGWFFSFTDVLLIILDVFLLVSFGTLLSSIINGFLTSQGQISAVGTIVSSSYGFISGAYMPISTFNVGLQNVLMFFPSTYGTLLIKNHAMNGPLKALSAEGVPNEAIDAVKKTNDLSPSFFGHEISLLAIYAVVISTVLLLVAIYVLINAFPKIKKEKTKILNAVKQ